MRIACKSFLFDQNVCPIVSTVSSMTEICHRNVSPIVIRTIQDTDTEQKTNDKIRMIYRNTYFMHRREKEKEEQKRMKIDR
jgi:hypothetical protein